MTDPASPPSPPPSRRTLRGATIVAAPMALVGVMGLVAAVVTALWTASGAEDVGAASWATFSIAAAIGAAGFGAARGCRVVVTDGEVRDMVAWRTVHRVRCERLEAVRVRRGPWRVFEMELDDGARRVVLGAGPAQFPTTLLADAAARDLAAIDTMLGLPPTGGP